MKIMKSLMAVSFAAAAVQAHAVPFAVTGTLLGQNTVGATVNPTVVLHVGSTAYNIATSSQTLPTFTGTWNIATATTTLTGQFADFAQYSTSVNAGILCGTGVVNQPDNVFNFAGGTRSYN